MPDETQASEASFITKTLDAIKSIFVRDEGNFQVFTGKDGKPYWMSKHTNIFEDQDKEILSQKAHERYLARVNLGLVDKPTLRTWHVKGTDHGQADEVWEHAGFVFAIGHFDNTPEAEKAIDWYRKNKGKVELSHGFYYPHWALKDGVYDSYNTFEISTLPTGAAANLFTSFEEIEKMALTDKQRQWIKNALGDEAVARVDQKMAEAEKDSEVLKAIDTKYKDFVDPIATPEVPPTEAKPTEENKPMAELIVGLIEGMGVLQQAIVAQEAEKKSAAKAKADADAKAETRIAALENTVKSLHAELTLAPRAASTSSETLATQAEQDEAKKNLAADVDPFWAAAGLEVKKG